MAKITIQSFTVEGFKDQASWIGKLFSPLNSFMTQVVQAFQNRITVSDNLFQELKSITFINETSNFPIQFTTKFNKFPQMVILGKIVASDGSLPSEYPLVDWTFRDGYLVIDSISGLTASKKYTATILIVYE